jgi:hypothetical protein
MNTNTLKKSNLFAVRPDLFPRTHQNSKNIYPVLSPSPKNAKHLSCPIVKARYQSCSLVNRIRSDRLISSYKQNRVLSVQFENRKTTEMAYLLGFLYTYSFTLDINTTVSTWNDRLTSMSGLYFSFCSFAGIGRAWFLRVLSVSGNRSTVFVSSRE